MPTHPELLAYMDAVAPSVGLCVAPAHRDAVAEALAGLLAQGQTLLMLKLPHDTDAAPRYTP